MVSDIFFNVNLSIFYASLYVWHVKKGKDGLDSFRHGLLDYVVKHVYCRCQTEKGKILHKPVNIRVSCVDIEAGVWTYGCSYMVSVVISKGNVNILCCCFSTFD